MSGKHQRARRRAYRQASMQGYPRLAGGVDRQTEADRIRSDPESLVIHLRHAVADGGVWAAARSLVSDATGIAPQHVSDSLAAGILGGDLIASIAVPRLAACRSEGSGERQYRRRAGRAESIERQQARRNAYHEE